MIFKEVVKDHWVNMENIVAVDIYDAESLRFTRHDGGWLQYNINVLKDTPEHWRNWLRERS